MALSHHISRRQRRGLILAGSRRVHQALVWSQSSWCSATADRSFHDPSTLRSSVSFHLLAFRFLFSGRYFLAQETHIPGKREKKKWLLVVKTFLSVLPPRVSSCNCRKTVWFLTATCKALRKRETQPGCWNRASASRPVPWPHCDSFCGPEDQKMLLVQGCRHGGRFQIPTASAGKGRAGQLCTVRAEKMKAPTAGRCWENPVPGTASKERATSALGQRGEGHHPGAHPALQAQWQLRLLPACSDSWELKRRRRGGSCQLVPSPTLSPEGLTTALGIPDLGCFCAKVSLAMNKLLLAAGVFWDALQYTAVTDVRLMCHVFW